MMTTPCPSARKASWTAEILWVGADTQGWAVLGERFLRAEGAVDLLDGPPRSPSRATGTQEFTKALDRRKSAFSLTQPAFGRGGTSPT